MNWLSSRAGPVGHRISEGATEGVFCIFCSAGLSRRYRYKSVNICPDGVTGELGRPKDCLIGAVVRSKAYSRRMRHHKSDQTQE